MLESKKEKKGISMVFEVKFPILGFEKIREMKLAKIDDLFMRLENAQEPNPSFTLVNPYMLRDYTFDIPLYIKSLLSIDSQSTILVANVMVVSKPIENSTINFVAPIIFNFDNQTMAQLVLDSSKYPTFGLAEPISNYLSNEES